MSWSITLIVGIFALLQWIEKRSYMSELKREVDSRKQSDEEWEVIIANMAKAFGEYHKATISRQRTMLAAAKTQSDLTEKGKN